MECPTRLFKYFAYPAASITSRAALSTSQPERCFPNAIVLVTFLYPCVPRADDDVENFDECDPELTGPQSQSS